MDSFIWSLCISAFYISGYWKINSQIIYGTWKFAFCIQIHEVFRSSEICRCVILRSSPDDFLLLTCLKTLGTKHPVMWCHIPKGRQSQTHHRKNLQVFKIHSVLKCLFNPLNVRLNPICHLLALLEAHHILHVSRIRINIKHWIFRLASVAFCLMIILL